MSPGTPVTSKTAVLPAPHFPPLPNVGPPPVRGTSDPLPPDVKIMVPDAPAIIAAQQQAEAGPAVDTTGGGEFGPPSDVFPYRVYDLFIRPPSPIADPRAWPIADTLTVYLMAILARFSYQHPGPLKDAARDVILSVLGKRYTYAMIEGAPTAPELRLDVWRAPDEAQIVVIQGSTTLTEWENSAMALWQPVPGVSTDLQVYFGIRRSADRALPFLKAAITAPELHGIPTVLVGHSLGGAIAQLHTAALNADYKARVPTAAAGFPVVSQYSFGAPAWAGQTASSIPNGWLDAHCRCYLPEDPVPFLTQVAILRLAGVSAGIQLLSSMKLPNVESTRHYANKNVELVRLNTAERKRARDAIWKNLFEHAAGELALLRAAHAMSSYTDAAYARAQRSTARRPDLVDLLTQADRLMDQSDLTTRDGPVR